MFANPKIIITTPPDKVLNREQLDTTVETIRRQRPRPATILRLEPGFTYSAAQIGSRRVALPCAQLGIVPPSPSLLQALSEANGNSQRRQKNGSRGAETSEPTIDNDSCASVRAHVAGVPGNRITQIRSSAQEQSKIQAAGRRVVMVDDGSGMPRYYSVRLISRPQPSPVPKGRQERLMGAARVYAKSLVLHTKGTNGAATTGCDPKTIKEEIKQVVVEVAKRYDRDVVSNTPTDTSKDEEVYEQCIDGLPYDDDTLRVNVLPGRVKSLSRAKKLQLRDEVLPFRPLSDSARRNPSVKGNAYDPADEPLDRAVTAAVRASQVASVGKEKAVERTKEGPMQERKIAKPKSRLAKNQTQNNTSADKDPPPTKGNSNNSNAGVKASDGKDKKSKKSKAETFRVGDFDVEMVDLPNIGDLEPHEIVGGSLEFLNFEEYCNDPGYDLDELSTPEITGSFDIDKLPDGPEPKLEHYKMGVSYVSIRDPELSGSDSESNSSDSDQGLDIGDRVNKRVGKNRLADDSSQAADSPTIPPEFTEGFDTPAPIPLQPSPAGRQQTNPAITITTECYSDLSSSATDTDEGATPFVAVPRQMLHRPITARALQRELLRRRAGGLDLDSIKPIDGEDPALARQHSVTQAFTPPSMHITPESHGPGVAISRIENENRQRPDEKRTADPKKHLRPPLSHGAVGRGTVPTKLNFWPRGGSVPKAEEKGMEGDEREDAAGVSCSEAVVGCVPALASPLHFFFSGRRRRRHHSAGVTRANEGGRRKKGTGGVQRTESQRRRVAWLETDSLLGRGGGGLGGGQARRREGMVDAVSFPFRVGYNCLLWWLAPFISTLRAQ